MISIIQFECLTYFALRPIVDSASQSVARNDRKSEYLSQFREFMHHVFFYFLSLQSEGACRVPVARCLV